ncbi:MAG TPA: flagellar assembly protein FliW [Chthonomonadaceae bacterium]|nr:flagellar assembly protein FliW [Chthonomonadaceae bacterium]
MAIILDTRRMAPSLDIAYVQTMREEGTAWEKAVSAARSQQRTRRVPTTRFGALEVEEDLIIRLPEGLIGFEACRQFVVVRSEERNAFRWLQSLDEPAVAFPVVEPGEFRPDYAPVIADSDAEFLELTAETPKLIFAIVTVPSHNPRAMTANLLGPLVINGLTRRGKQVIVQSEGYTTRHVIMEELLRAASLQAGAGAGNANACDAPAGQEG